MLLVKSISLDKKKKFPDLLSNYKIEATTGQKPRANPYKIIAGLEPELTNEFLQLLAMAVLRHVNLFHCFDILESRSRKTK
jgi:hypothetical protein